MADARLRVAVVGGGIGGLTATLALLRAGVDVACFERASELREAGAGIQIGPNASRVLLGLGLAPALSSVGVRPAAFEVRRWDDGRLLGRVAGGPDIDAAFGAPYFTFHRADLHAALHGAVPSGVLRLGARCVGAAHLPHGVELRLDDGSTVVADAVVGADGLRSTLRDEVQRSAPRFSGKMACRVLVPSDAVPDLADPRRCGCGSDRAPTSWCIP